MITREGNVDKGRYLIENFDRAIAEGWIEVYYQPVIRGASGRVCDEEALVRWDDPKLGIMNPADFIPVLEAVNLIHELDLYVLEQVLEKMEQQREKGLYLVPIAINLSPVDFFACDIFDEIMKRVANSTIPAELIAIEVAAGAIGNNEQIISQLIRFTEKGFKLWLDDYGGGGVSPAILQIVNFDLLKINMLYTSKITENQATRVLVAELIKMAMSLGIETVAEGVEYKAQIEFLREVGCAKLQGFYFCRPICKSDIFERYIEKKAIGFENPAETDYFATVGKISLYDLSFTKNENDDEDLDDYFDSLPIAILETDDAILKFVRGNKSFKDFVRTNFQNTPNVTSYVFADVEGLTGSYSFNVIRQCARDGKKKIFDDRTKDGKTVQMLVQKLATNPVTGVTAVALVILSISSNNLEAGDLTYNYIARALSEDYIYTYYVDLETGEFVEYSTDGFNRDISVARKGGDFFNQARKDAHTKLYREDLPLFLEAFDKDKILKNIDDHGSFTLSYRMVTSDGPRYVSMKAVRSRAGNHNLIMGISDVDAQMKNQEVLERIKEERITFARISALSGDIISIYMVNPDDNSYQMYKTSPEFTKLGFAREGKDFFKESRAASVKAIFADDLDAFLRNFDRDRIMEQILNTGMFVYNYRLNIDGMAKYVCLKAALIEEADGPQLIFGIMDVDGQVRKEIEYAETLLEAENRAIRDELTGVKNKHAYVDAEIELNEMIKDGEDPEFAVAVFDINGLKDVNDTKGHQAGDEFIRNGCKIICDVFAHSPVYRIGGDEFVAIIRGQDYEKLEALVKEVQAVNAANSREGQVTLAVGYSKNNGDRFVADVFQRADARMYENKFLMKQSC